MLQQRIVRGHLRIVFVADAPGQSSTFSSAHTVSCSLVDLLLAVLAAVLLRCVVASNVPQTAACTSSHACNTSQSAVALYD